MLLDGIFPAITTPYYPDGRLYLRKLEHNVERYSRTPVAGMVVLGSTGEAVMVDTEEARELLKTAAEAAAPAKVLIAGVGQLSALSTLQLAEFAAAQSYDAVLVRTPNFYTPHMSPLAMLTYFRTVADRSPLPVILYTIPKFTQYDLSVELIAELALHPNIIGIKDSSGDLEKLRAIVDATQTIPLRSVAVTSTFAAVTARMLQPTIEAKAASFISAESLAGPAAAIATAPPTVPIKTRTREVGFQVLNGSADKIASAHALGATGSVLAMAACAPQACHEVYIAFKENDAALAAEKQTRLAAASSYVVNDLGVAGVKYACELNGYYGGRPRLPLLPLTGREQEEVSRCMADLRN